MNSGYNLLDKRFEGLRELILFSIPLRRSIHFRVLSKDILSLYKKYDFIFEWINEYKLSIDKIWDYDEFNQMLIDHKFLYKEKSVKVELNSDVRFQALKSDCSWAVFLTFWKEKKITKDNFNVCYNVFIADRLFNVEITLATRDEIFKLKHENLTVNVIMFLGACFDSTLPGAKKLADYILPKMSKSEKLTSLYLMSIWCSPSHFKVQPKYKVLSCDLDFTTKNDIRQYLISYGLLEDKNGKISKIYLNGKKHVTDKIYLICKTLLCCHI